MRRGIALVAAVVMMITSCNCAESMRRGPGGDGGGHGASNNRNKSRVESQR